MYPDTSSSNDYGFAAAAKNAAYPDTTSTSPASGYGYGSSSSAPPPPMASLAAEQELPSDVERVYPSFDDSPKGAYEERPQERDRQERFMPVRE